MFSTGIILLLGAFLLTNIWGRPIGRGLNFADHVALVCFCGGLGLCIASLAILLWRLLP